MAKATKKTTGTKKTTTKKASTAKKKDVKTTTRKTTSAATKTAPKKAAAKKPAPKKTTAAVKKPVAQPTEVEIRARARQIWLDEGRPVGQDEVNWLEAEKQLRDERGA